MTKETTLKALEKCKLTSLHLPTIFVGFSRFWFQAETGKTEV